MSQSVSQLSWRSRYHVRLGLSDGLTFGLWDLNSVSDHHRMNVLHFAGHRHPFDLQLPEFESIMANATLLTGQMGTLSLARSCRPTRMAAPSNGSTSRTCMKARDSFHVEVNSLSFSAAAGGRPTLSVRSWDSVLQISRGFSQSHVARCLLRRGSLLQNLLSFGLS